MQVETFTTQSEALEIHGNIHWPPNLPAPGVICSHGLFSSKESPKFIAIAEYLAREGFAAIRYDHRGCGQSAGKIEETTVSGRLEDLAAVYRFAGRDPRINGNIGLLGSSMGGYISLFTAARYPAIKALCVWATPFKMRGAPAQVGDETYPLLKDCFYEDLQKYQLREVLGQVKPCLVLHGQDDELVPVWHAERIYAGLADPKFLEIFPGGDHRFTVERHRRRAMQRSAEFFKKYL
ncbi:MAG: alpha/beta fold hydrolase [Desulfobacterales bacterium]|nr:MAG: alpha/beta fold hydrolase [Desulfobacterales bacterium]